MISICIPVYNYDVRNLVYQLSKEISLLDEQIEIVVIDDCSSRNFKEINGSVKELCSSFIELKSNIGRSRIRNKFLEFTQHPWLLFLDCDGVPVSKNFLSKYVRALKTAEDVYVGGREYGPKPENVNQLLRWKFGHIRESKTALVREKSKFRSFMTNNFIIRKSVLKDIGFDESLTGYGHEDTLFGFELRKNNYRVVHIENAVLNCHLDNTEEFLFNTNQGIKNLHKISEIISTSQEFVESVTLLKSAKKILPFKVLFLGIYDVFEGGIERNLMGPNPNLFAFDLYKLNKLLKLY